MWMMTKIIHIAHNAQVATPTHVIDRLADCVRGFCINQLSKHASLLILGSLLIL